MFCCKAINILVVLLLIWTTGFASVYKYNSKNKNNLIELAHKGLKNKVYPELAVELFPDSSKNKIKRLSKEKQTIEDSTTSLNAVHPSIDNESVYNLKIKVFDKFTKRPIGGGLVIFVKSQGDESINKSGPGKQYTIKGGQEIIFMVKKESYEDHKFRVSTIAKDPSKDIIIDVYLKHKLNEDEKAYEDLIENCGNLKKEGLKYMVQIGAFRSRKIKHFESLNLGYKIFEQRLQGLFKYMVYNAETPYEIDNIRQDVINQGISDAFVVPYNKGLRITVKKALKILIPNMDDNEEFISFPILTK